jgi:hypothetical protein
MQGLDASTSGVGVGGMGVLVDVAVGRGVGVGVPAGRGVPQADELRTRAIAKLTSQNFFISGSCFEISICADMDLKNFFHQRVLTPNVNIDSRDCLNPGANQSSFDPANTEASPASRIRRTAEEYQSEMKQR